MLGLLRVYGVYRQDQTVHSGVAYVASSPVGDVIRRSGVGRRGQAQYCPARRLWVENREGERIGPKHVQSDGQTLRMIARGVAVT